MRRQRTTGKKEYFQRADHALAIARLDAGGRLAIHAPQQAMEDADATPVGNRLEPRAGGFVAARTWKEAPRQRPVIEAGSSSEDPTASYL